MDVPDLLQHPPIPTPVYRQPICCGVSVAKQRYASLFASMSPCNGGANHAWYFAAALLTLIVRPVEQNI